MKPSIIAFAIGCFCLAGVATCTIEPTEPSPPVVTVSDRTPTEPGAITEEAHRQAFLEGLRCMAGEDPTEMGCIKACGKYQDSDTFAACVKAIEFAESYIGCGDACVE